MARQNVGLPVRIPVGYTMLEGIRVRVTAEEWRGEWRVWGYPTAEGKRTAHYREVRKKLGDDWDFDITNTWAEPGRLPLKMQERIADLTMPGWRKRPNRNARTARRNQPTKWTPRGTRWIRRKIYRGHDWVLLDTALGQAVAVVFRFGDRWDWVIGRLDVGGRGELNATAAKRAVLAALWRDAKRRGVPSARRNRRRRHS